MKNVTLPPLMDQFADQVRRFRPQLFGLLFYRLRDWHRAEDAAQDVLLRAFRWAASGRLRDPFHPTDPGRMPPWLYSIARRRLIDLDRSRDSLDRWQTLPLPENIPAPDSDPAAPAERADTARAVRAAAAALPGSLPGLLALYLDGHSWREAARLTGTSPDTAGRRFNRQRERLRSLLSRPPRQVVKAAHVAEPTPPPAAPPAGRARGGVVWFGPAGD
jgi:RNA polymerase sigma factor (sigma-70 family)